MIHAPPVRDSRLRPAYTAMPASPVFWDWTGLAAGTLGLPGRLGVVGIYSVRVAWHTVQVKVRTPSAVVVEGVVTTPSFHL